MLKFRHLMPVLLGLAGLVGSMPASVAATPNAAVLAPGQGTARVWFLRPSSSASTDYGAAPVIYANGAPIGAISANSEFYRDVTPGSYSFSVQNYGLANHAADQVQLAPGSQTYLEIQYVPAWEEGYASGAGGESHSFFVLNMSPQLAQAYLPSLTDLGAR